MYKREKKTIYTNIRVFNSITGTKLLHIKVLNKMCKMLIYEQRYGWKKHFFFNNINNPKDNKPICNQSPHLPIW